MSCDPAALTEFISEEERLRNELKRMEEQQRAEPAMCWMDVLPGLNAPEPIIECDQCGLKQSEWNLPLVVGASCPRHYLDDDSCDGIIHEVSK